MTDLKSQVYNLIRQFSGQANTLTIPRPFITMTGSLEAALLLSQIMYWSDRSTMKDGWFAKTYIEWGEELTLTQYQVSKAVKALADFGVETKIKKFKDVPTLHYRINPSVFINRVMKFFDNPGDIKNFDNPLTEPTTEPTNTISPDGDAQSDSKAKHERPRNPIFDAVALGSFGLSNVNGDKVVGALVGKIVKWLKNQSGVTAERIAQFYIWYSRETNDADAPRDVGKFGAWWMKFDANGTGAEEINWFSETEEFIGGKPW